jgi:cysteine desulfurase/selenocysteine lyase
VSNVLGTVNPVREIAAAAHRAGARVLVDGAQGVPHLPVRVDDLDCDFLAFSAHKMCGPTGVGILYGRPDALAETEPLLHGGEMIARVEFDRATWAEVPRRFEGGTPNIAGVIGFGWALAYLGALGMERVRRRDAELTGYALERLRGVPGLRVVGEAPERGALVSFDVAGVHPHDLAQFLDREGIAIRSGHMCAQPLLRKLGFPALNRASFYFYNLEREIDALAEAIGAARRYFA